MARTIQYRTLFTAACATAALTLAGPLAAAQANAATPGAQTARPVPAPIATTSAPARAQVIAAAAPAPAPAPVVPSSDSQTQSVDSLLSALPDPSSLGAATPEQSQSAQKVIVSQLNAFRSGDFQQADAFQAQSLRANFPSMQQFRIAMSEAYPEFTAYKSLQFGMTTTDKTGRFVVVPVTLTGQDGVTVQALYIMLHQQSDTASGPTAANPTAYPTNNAAAALAPKSNYQVLTVLGGMNPHPIVQIGGDYQAT